MGSRPLPARDKVILGMLGFFTLFNIAVDLPLVWHAREIPSLVGQRWYADFWALYAPADRTWIVGPWSLAQEALNVFVTTLVNLWLMWAIVRTAAYRHALQLTLGAYLSYSVVLYFLAGHVSGYEGMESPSVFTFLLFYGATLPWLLGHLYMAYDSFVAITRRG
jgi:cholestenol Delta-isomerase